MNKVNWRCTRYVFTYIRGTYISRTFGTSSSTEGTRNWTCSYYASHKNQKMCTACDLQVIVHFSFFFVFLTPFVIFALLDFSSCFLFLLLLSHFYSPACGLNPWSLVSSLPPPPGSRLQFLSRIRMVLQSHCSSIFRRVLVTHALALSASQFVHKKKP